MSFRYDYDRRFAADAGHLWAERIPEMGREMNTDWRKVYQCPRCLTIHQPWQDFIIGPGWPRWCDKCGYPYPLRAVRFRLANGEPEIEEVENGKEN